MSHRGMRLTCYDASDIQVGLCEKRLYQIPLINHLYPSQKLPLVGVSHISWQAYIFACVCV